jgi:hypothetical protein
VFIVGDPSLLPSNYYVNVVNALVSMGIQNDDFILSPGQSLPETMGGKNEYPIYVTIPPTQLGDFLDNLPESFKARIDDFVFFSGGFEYGNIEDVLKERGTASICVLFSSACCITL